MSHRRWVTAAFATASLAVVPGPALAANPPPATPQPIAAKRLDCQPGQIDVNSATAEQLAAGLKLSRPVAQRVVAHREPLYLDLNDLLTVEGIGPGALAGIERQGVACVDLPTSPPPTDDFVCRPGDGRVDVNRPGSLAEFTDMFGAPTARRIVAGMPYAGVKPMIAEHVPGVGPGKQGRLLARLCDTPPTIDHGTTRWGWISTAGGRVEHPDGATLTVGPGVIDDPHGMWGSVQPLPHDSFDGGPKFDLQVHGPWQGGGNVVYATLPPDGFSPPGASDAWTPTLLHYTGDDPEVHAEDGVYVGPDGRWTTAVSSLSPLQSILQPLATFSLFSGFTSLSRDDIARAISSSILGRGYAPPGCGAASGTDRLRVNVNPASMSTGQFGGFVRPAAKWCVEGDAASGHLTFKLSNMGLPTFGYQEWSGPADTLGVSISADVSPATEQLLKFFNRGVKPGPDSLNVVYGPGVTVNYDLPASDNDQEVELIRSGALFPQTMALDTVFIATEHLGQVPGLAIPGAVLDCVETAQSTDLASVVGCVEQVARDGTAARTVLAGISRALNVLSLLRGGAEYVSLLVQSSRFEFDGDITFRLKKPVVAAPEQPSDGNPATAKGTRILKRTGSSAAYVLDDAGVAHHIPDGGTYICNAKHYMVQFNVDDSEWAAEVKSVGADATCPGGPERGLGPATVPAGVLLRREDGKIFLTHAYGGTVDLVPLFEGQPVFDCMVEQYLAWDRVTFDEYDNFQLDPVDAATGCGVSL